MKRKRTFNVEVPPLALVAAAGDAAGRSKVNWTRGQVEVGGAEDILTVSTAKNKNE